MSRDMHGFFFNFYLNRRFSTHVLRTCVGTCATLKFGKLNCCGFSRLHPYGFIFNSAILIRWCFVLFTHSGPEIYFTFVLKGNWPGAFHIWLSEELLTILWSLADFWNLPYVGDLSDFWYQTSWFTHSIWENNNFLCDIIKKM